MKPRRFGLPVLLVCLVACTVSKKKAEPTVRQPVTKPDIQGEDVSYQAGDTALKGYIAWDANQTAPRPGVIVVHEWWGHNEYVRGRARQLAEAGYTALALDMYGDGRKTEHPDDAWKFMREASNRAEVTEARFSAAHELLKNHSSTDPANIAAIGYCFGGAVVLQMARSGADLAGVASFHGHLATDAPAAPGVVKAKVLVLHGADDPFVSKEQVVDFKKEMETAGVDYVFIEYPGAVHAFTNPAATEQGKRFNLPLAYDEEADKKSWAELQEFLRSLFGAS